MRITFLLTLFLYSLPAYLQKPFYPKVNSLAKSNPRINSPSAIEICNNGFDDDGNGLVDCKDYSCYFKPGESACSCYPLKLVWLCDGTNDIYWVDLETQIERKVGTMPVQMGDITWTPQGKLYGMNNAGIFEIDPATANTTFLTTVPGYSLNNAMTCDAAGNLYMSALTPELHSIIIKYDPIARVTTVICDVSQYGLVSGGDLVFSNGLLYLACGSGTLAAIDVNTGTAVVHHISGLPQNTADNFGIASLTGGLLYISCGNEIYAVDPITFNAALAYTLSNPTLRIYGMADYNDLCNAPSICSATVHISFQNSPPFCRGTNAILKAEGSGLGGATEYFWLKPDGTQSNSQVLYANSPGTYRVRYHTIPDTCGAWDTILVEITDPPQAFVGNDTTFCEGTILTLQSRNNVGVENWLWSNGFTSQRISVNQPGDYWLEVSNACGRSRDTIHITQTKLPLVSLGGDFSICQDEIVYLKNNSQRKVDEKYLWSDGTSRDSLQVAHPGFYWLASSNACGTVRDTLVVRAKDSCTCKPVYASVELGPGRELCKYDTLVLTNALHSSSFHYMWNDGTGQNSLIVKAPGRYWVNVSTYCNTVSDTVVVTEKQHGCDCMLFIPNAFSPNNNSRNQKFRIKASCPLKGELFIYNRWGQLIYHTADAYAGWDGTFKGLLQQSGTYVYELKYRFANRPGTFVEKGTVVLIR